MRSLPLALVSLALIAACGRHPEEEEGRASASASPSASSVASAAAPTVPAPTPAPPKPAAAGETWNAAQIDWVSFDEASRRAKQQNKPILLVVYTTWCPHCRNYSHVFDDPRVVGRARDFVMVHIDSDAEPDVASKYARDGGYIPRTYFLAPDGTANTAVHAPRARYQYFYDEHDPSALLASMDAEIAATRR